mgnify:CR=1 FL=1
MRLRQIKISGFKSFADLTTIEVPSSIVGIVGPNGCGKSNVIEAVRWALGEGKASDLRCKSMSELIFAGSDNRKPAGRAMVELVFDNSDSTLQGPWGAYSEISVKRVLTRDNTSSYLINNQQVRATDVRDLFMGTGLGANSYAIISQGMVTEFAKDSPERRREYLEEAAGVSKYKKRRKEAESRLASTRANLERVTDLQITRRESVARLEAEAQVALRYQELDQERKTKESLWWFTQMVESKNAIDCLNAQIADVQAQLTSSDSNLIAKRESLQALREQLNASNINVLARTENLSQVDKDISKIEGNIRSIIERRSLLKAQAQSYEQLFIKREEEIQKQSERLHALIEEQEEKEELVASAEERQYVLEERQIQAEEIAQNKKTIYEGLHAKALEVENAVRNQSMEMSHLTKTKQDLSERLQKLKIESAQTEKPDEAHFKELKLELTEIKEESCALQEEREELQSQLEESRLAYEEIQENIRQKEQRFASIQARLTALREIDDKARAGDKLNQWLATQGLSSMSRLFELLQVNGKWARALEAVLRERVNAIGISRLQMAAGFVYAPPPARLTFYSTQGHADYEPIEGFRNLVDELTFDLTNADTESVLQTWLAPYLLVDSVSEAIANLNTLPRGYHFVTPEGHIIDAQSVNFWADDDQSGLLSRRAEITELETEEKTQRLEVESAHAALGQINMTLSSLSDALRSTNTRFEDVRRQEGTLALDVTRLEAAIVAYQRRSEELSAWIEETALSLEEVCAQIDEAEERFSHLDEDLATAQEKAEEAQFAWEKAQEAFRQAQQDYNVFAYTQREVEMALKTIKERIAETQRSQLVAQTEQKDWQAKIQELKAQLESLDEEEGLQELLLKRENAQAELSLARQTLENTTASVIAIESELAGVEDQKRLCQAKISDFLTKRQQHEVDFATVKGRLEELQYDDQALREVYERDHPKQNQLRLEVERLAKSMAALGAVNHAALEQLKIQTQEVERIDREVADLEQAIVTIESAIKRIDQETRALLLDTFNRVNAAFNQKFVQLFKGGQARLVMTSEDALEAGIEMYANPPGKHPHSIRQLSGGELTLTATALVFAFFTLNPAPFCLLDEVDAPLDEANQERLSRLVGSMSENTQFMMITHHRVTMEHTKQLIGVTMKEPGVSRVVSVDIKEATQYAQKNK